MKLIATVLAVLSLAMPAARAQDFTLSPEPPQLEWNGWLVTIYDLEFQSSIWHYGEKKAGPDSTFVRLAMKYL